MTLPTDIFLPLPKDYARDGDNDRYMNDLVYRIQDMYGQVVDVVNGSFRNDSETASSQWIPTLDGSVSGTFTYTHQYGYVMRSGIMTEVWFDIGWSATTATTNFFLNLPYIVTKSNGMPFAGIAVSQTITYTGSLSCFAVPSTTRLEFWQSSSGGASSNVSVQPVGTVQGYCRYIGVSDG